MPGSTACAHLATSAPSPYPFDIEIVLDEQVGITDAVVRCRQCQQPYLLELIAWSGPQLTHRTYRTSLLDDDVVDDYVHNRSRGSCDVNRAGAEWSAVMAQARLTDLELTLDVRSATVLAARRLPRDADIPMAHWRARLR